MATKKTPREMRICTEKSGRHQSLSQNELGMMEMRSLFVKFVSSEE
jgi:hypothetical protein